MSLKPLSPPDKRSALKEAEKWVQWFTVAPLGNGDWPLPRQMNWAPPLVLSQLLMSQTGRTAALQINNPVCTRLRPEWKTTMQLRYRVGSWPYTRTSAMGLGAEPQNGPQPARQWRRVPPSPQWQNSPSSYSDDSQSAGKTTGSNELWGKLFSASLIDPC